MEKLLKLAAALLILAAVGTLGAALALGAHHRDRIYPGVAIEGINVGGLTVAEARARVASALPSPDARTIAITIGDRTWHLPWSAVGQRYDLDAALDAAYQIGRERPWWLGAIAVIHPADASISVPITPADAALVQSYVDGIASEVALPPRNASLTIVRGEVRNDPGREGQELDVETASAQIQKALVERRDQVTLTPEPVPPRLSTTEPAASRVEARLSHPLVLVVHDPLTGDPEQGGYRAAFAVGREEMARWLRIEQRTDGFYVTHDTAAIRAWVETIASRLGEERILDVGMTTVRISEALRSETEARAYAQVRHPPHAYVVQPGDTFYDIAYNHGFPQWWLEQANPDVEPGVISAGQVITIPSIDVLFPHPLVPGKRIEIDLPTQTLRAYEEETLVSEFRVSSGISSTPTLAGQFQILFKEENAFAPRWRLDMPYFMAIYEEGEGFYNGIHELPITSYGVRLSSGVLGYPASYGCIILDIGDAEALYNWAEVGTLVRVIGVAPGTPFGRQTLEDIAPPVSEPEP